MVIYDLYHLYSNGYALFAIKIINDILDDILQFQRNFMSSRIYLAVYILEFQPSV